MKNKKRIFLLIIIVAFCFALGFFYSEFSANIKSDELKIETENNQDEIDAENIEVHDTSVNYDVSLIKSGWYNSEASSDIIAGDVTTFGDSVNAIKINTPKEERYIVEYEAYENNVGWTNRAQNGEVLGKEDGENTFGAMKVYLKYKDATEKVCDKLNVYYSVFINGEGWTPYSKNGEIAGMDDNTKDIRAIKIYISDVQRGSFLDVEKLQNLNYKNERMEVNIDKFRGYNTCYYIAKIKIKDANSQVNMVNSKSGLKPLSKLLEGTNAVIGINASSFGTDDIVINKVVDNGVSVPYNKSIQYTMAIDKNGMMFTPYSRENPYYKPQTDKETLKNYSYTGEELINKWNVKNTIHFGPPLIVNGVEYQFNNYTDRNPITVIGQINTNEYIILIADGRDTSNRVTGMVLSDAKTILKEYGTEFGFNLDGGGSSTLYYRGKIINRPSSGSERAIPDAIYFNE